VGEGQSIDQQLQVFDSGNRVAYPILEIYHMNPDRGVPAREIAGAANQSQRVKKSGFDFVLNLPLLPW
jgi:hypothetical protein